MGIQSARAACIDAPDAGTRQLQTLAASDPNLALGRAEAALRHAAASGTPATSIAWLHTVRAQAFTALERDSDARAAAADGLKLASATRDAVHFALVSIDAENVYDAAGIVAAMQRVERARTAASSNHDVSTCLLITLGTLQYRQDNSDLAIATLMQAYRTTAETGNRKLRVVAADALSSVMREIGDYRQALELNSEVIEWNKDHRETLSLSVSQYLRGNILADMRDFAAAARSFEDARTLSVALGDTLGVAFSDMRICEVQIELGRLTAARENCHRALQSFSAAHAGDVVKQTRTLLANIDLQEGRADLALAALNEVLADGAADLQPRNVAAIFKLRAKANAARKNFTAAYSDLNEYTTRYVKANEARRAREIAGLRARFETDRQIERNADLQRELEQSRQRQRELQRLTGWAVSAGALVIALLTILLVEARRHRRQLALLANVDALTQLPNRRHTADLAAQAIANATATQKPLTLALIDLDHFKVINDELGHAAGDQVLRDFARLGRDAIRTTDTMGRWGGEEFLLLMPDTTPDFALAIVERLRNRALEINLPSGTPDLKVSLSAGLACTGASIATLDELIAFADAALYSAKEEGRNRVRLDGRNVDAATSAVHRALARG